MAAILIMSNRWISVGTFYKSLSMICKRLITQESDGYFVMFSCFKDRLAQEKHGVWHFINLNFSLASKNKYDATPFDFPASAMHVHKYVNSGIG